MPTELRCACPDLINGHYHDCPYAARALCRDREVQRRMLNRRAEEGWEPLDSVRGEDCAKDVGMAATWTVGWDVGSDGQSGECGLDGEGAEGFLDH